jgi:hypothetical protein
MPPSEFDIYTQLRRRGVPLALSRGTPETPKTWFDQVGEMTLQEMEERALPVRMPAITKVPLEELDDEELDEVCDRHDWKLKEQSPVHLTYVCSRCGLLNNTTSETE